MDKILQSTSRGEVGMGVFRKSCKEIALEAALGGGQVIQSGSCGKEGESGATTALRLKLESVWGTRGVGVDTCKSTQVTATLSARRILTQEYRQWGSISSNGTMKIKLCISVV